MARVRVGLVLVGVVVLFCALWGAGWQPGQPTPTEVDAARMKRLGEWLLRVGNLPATAEGIPVFDYFLKRSEIEGRDDIEEFVDLFRSARTAEEWTLEQIMDREFHACPYEFGVAPLKERRPFVWDKHDDPDGYRLVARLQAVEGGGWTVVVERMRAKELEALRDRYGV